MTFEGRRVTARPLHHRSLFVHFSWVLLPWDPRLWVCPLLQSSQHSCPNLLLSETIKLLERAKLEQISTGFGSSTALSGRPQAVSTEFLQAGDKMRGNWNCIEMGSGPRHWTQSEGGLFLKNPNLSQSLDCFKYGNGAELLRRPQINRDDSLISARHNQLVLSLNQKTRNLTVMRLPFPQQPFA